MQKTFLNFKDLVLGQPRSNISVVPCFNFAQSFSGNGINHIALCPIFFFLFSLFPYWNRSIRQFVVKGLFGARSFCAQRNDNAKRFVYLGFGETTTTGRLLVISGDSKPSKSHIRICPISGWNGSPCEFKNILTGCFRPNHCTAK